jgi:hypothetical protein
LWLTILHLGHDESRVIRVTILLDNKRVVQMGGLVFVKFTLNLQRRRRKKRSEEEKEQEKDAGTDVSEASSSHMRLQ